MDVQVNWLAILLAGASSMAVGSFWYARSVFGNTWIKLAKIDMKKDSGPVAKPIILSLLSSFVTAYILAHVAYLSNMYFANSFFQDTLTTAFWLWLGLVAARIWTHDLFEGRPSKLTLITIGNEFFTLLLMALIIGSLKP